MTYLINKTKLEKLQDYMNFKYKADKDIILYYHFLTVKEDLKKDIDLTF